MARINVNPEAEVSANFEVAQPGTYRMRVEGSENFPAVQEFTSQAGNTCLKVRLVYCDPSIINKLDGTPSKNLGAIIDSSLVISPSDKQGKLRSFVESAGLQWADFDTDELAGKEVTALVGLDTYQGVEKNQIKRYLPAE